MGVYRLLLAVAVLLSHTGFSVLGRNQGVVAVISFFILSGYVMTALVERHYMSIGRVFDFYVDRAMRLFPQFLFYSLLTLALVGCFHPKSIHFSELSPWSIALNLSMIPLNFHRYFWNAVLLPQAWSLGLELQFYLIFPFVLLLRGREIALLLSLAFFLFPYFRVLDADVWSYRMLPGTLFIFLAGSFLRTPGRGYWLTIGAYILAAAFLVTAIVDPTTPAPLFEVTFGIVVGLPIVLCLSRMRFGWIEEFAGNLSYGIFLNHYFIFWCFQIAGFPRDSKLFVPSVLASSVLLAWLSYELVEKRALALRHRLRNRSEVRNYEEVGAGKPDAAPPAAL